MRKSTKQTFDNIVDTITCADGGLRFLKFKDMIEWLDSDAAKGDAHSIQIIALVTRFGNLINTAQILDQLTESAPKKKAKHEQPAPKRRR